jgi:hypothetical protein
MLLLMSAACQRAERSDAVDTTTPSQDTASSQSAPAQAPPEYPRSFEGSDEEQERQERIRVTGKDVDPSLFEREREEQERRERIHVLGKDHVTDPDDEQELGGGGMGGTPGTAGSGGSR